MIEEGDPIWTLMVSYFMQKDTDDDRTTSNDGRRIGGACDLDQLALLSALRSKRESVFDLEATAKFLQFNNMALSDIVEIQDALLGELNDRVAVFEDDRVVVKAALRQIHKEIRDEPPGTPRWWRTPRSQRAVIYISVSLFGTPSCHLLFFPTS